eukprot:4828120-Prymnesium_polylepis.2
MNDLIKGDEQLDQRDDLQVLKVHLQTSKRIGGPSKLPWTSFDRVDDARDADRNRHQDRERNCDCDCHVGTGFAFPRRLVEIVQLEHTRLTHCDAVNIFVG